MRTWRQRNWWSRKATVASLVGGGIVASAALAFQLAQPVDAQGIVVPALMSNVYSDRLAEANIELPGASIVEVLSIPDLPAGHYTVMGQVAATNYDTGSWTYVACYLRSEDRLLGTSVTYLQVSEPGGVNDTKSAPLVGHVEVSGPARLWVECQRHGQRGAPSIKGGSGRTQIIATRVW